MKIFLAGLYSHMNYLFTKDLPFPLYILETFYTLKTNSKKKDKFMNLVKNNAKDFLLDSGAFSFMHSFQHIKPKDMEKYIEMYINFIKKYDVKYFFEMDVDSLFGLKVVEEYRKYIEKETNKKSIPVWHNSRGLDYWDYMIDNYDYIAIGGITLKQSINKEKYLKLLNKLVIKAHKKNVKVHGLGFTKLQQLNRAYFDSVDSTSWIKSPSYGNTFRIDINKNMMVGKTKPKGARRKDRELIIHSFEKWVYLQKKMSKKGE